MNQTSWTQFVTTVEQDGFFEAVFANVSDWEQALDQRDNDEFSGAWNDAFQRVQTLAYTSASDGDAVTELRERVFKRVYGLTQSPEVAGYVSDDIGLVADSIAKSCHIEWVSQLFQRYRDGQFPN